MEQMDEINAHVAYDKTIILQLNLEQYNYIKYCVEKWTNQRARARSIQSAQRGSKQSRPRYQEMSIGFPQTLTEDLIFYAHGPPVEDELDKNALPQSHANKSVTRPPIPSISSTNPRRTPPKPRTSPSANPFVKDAN